MRHYLISTCQDLRFEPIQERAFSNNSIIISLNCKNNAGDRNGSRGFPTAWLTSRGVGGGTCFCAMTSRAFLQPTTLSNLGLVACGAISAESVVVSSTPRPC